MVHCACAEFPTTRAEMEAVTDKFDVNGDGLIDYKEFANALRPDRSAATKAGPVSESEKIQDEVKRQGLKCSCVKRFQIHKIGEGKYRVSTAWKYWTGVDAIA